MPLLLLIENNNRILFYLDYRETYSTLFYIPNSHDLIHRDPKPTTGSLCKTMDPNQTQQQLAQLTAALAFLMDKEFDFALLSEGDAKVWWRRYAATRKDDVPTSWEELQEAIREYFMSSGCYVHARNRLHNLRQTGSVQRYIEEFQKVRMIVGDVSDPEALDRFVRGLRLPVEEHVRIQNPKTVDRAMELALNYEDIRSRVRIPKQTWKQTTYRGPQPMELDYAETQHRGSRRGDKPKKKKVSKKHVECYACGEEHFVKDCPLVQVAQSLKGKAQSD